MLLPSDEAVTSYPDRLIHASTVGTDDPDCFTFTVCATDCRSLCDCRFPMQRVAEEQ
jgi:hypothetical protein